MFLLLKDQLSELDMIKQQEETLKSDYKSRLVKAVNLEKLKEQKPKKKKVVVWYALDSPAGPVKLLMARRSISCHRNVATKKKARASDHPGSFPHSPSGNCVISCNWYHWWW